MDNSDNPAKSGIDREAPSGPESGQEGLARPSRWKALAEGFQQQRLILDGRLEVFEGHLAILVIVKLLEC